MNLNERSEKYLKAKETLPPELHKVYKMLVEEYAFYTTTHYGRGYVAYSVLAELVRAGWRPTFSAEQDSAK